MVSGNRTCGSAPGWSTGAAKCDYRRMRQASFCRSQLDDSSSSSVWQTGRLTVRQFSVEAPQRSANFQVWRTLCSPTASHLELECPSTWTGSGTESSSLPHGLFQCIRWSPIFGVFELKGSSRLQKWNLNDSCRSRHTNFASVAIISDQAGLPSVTVDAC